MVVMVLERVTPGLRGELTRWMLEPKAGVFVGRLSAMVRDRLWELACQRMRSGAGMLIYTTDTEQGYAIEYWGETSRLVRDVEGLSLITIP